MAKAPKRSASRRIPPPTPRGKRKAALPRTMPRFARKAPPLAPGDPLATILATLPGANAPGNTIETNTNYAMSQDDRIVLVVQNGATIALPAAPLLAFPTYVIADGGIVTVNGPIQGGPATLTQGTIGIFTYSTISGMWSTVTSMLFFVPQSFANWSNHLSYAGTK